MRISKLWLLTLLPGRASSALLEATYRGRFQYLTGGICSGPPPVLTCKCASGASLVLLSTSHPTIVCTKSDSETAECVNTCTESVCSDIWDDSDTPITGVYGNITFSCTGDSVDAQFVYQDSGNGNCGIGGIDRRNFHIAQLGIACSDSPDGGFLFDGNSFDCTSGESLDAGRRVIPASQPDGIYTCAAGASCSSCTVEFDPVIIDVDEHRLRDECITSLDGMPIPNLSAPDPTPSPPGDYKATFQAEWAVAFVSKNTCDVLTNEGPTITLQCLNGGIRLIGTLESTVQCIRQGGDTLVCTEPSGESYLSSIGSPEYTGVTYVSTPAQIILALWFSM